MSFGIFVLGLVIGYSLCLGCFFVYIQYEDKINNLFQIPIMMYNSIINSMKGGKKVENGSI